MVKATSWVINMIPSHLYCTEAVALPYPTPRDLLPARSLGVESVTNRGGFCKLETVWSIGDCIMAVVTVPFFEQNGHLVVDITPLEVSFRDM